MERFASGKVGRMLAFTLLGEFMRPRSSRAPKAFFKCPNCHALYHVIKVEAGLKSSDREIACRVCAGPLPGRDRGFVVKYFLLRETDRTPQRTLKVT